MERSSKRISAAVLAIFMLASLLSGCGAYQQNSSSSAQASGSSAKTLRFSITVEPPSLDPQQTNAMAGASVEYHLFDGLMRDENGTVKPGVATGYDLSNDGLTYTFHLRKDAKWSDGVGVTAKDFVYSYQRLMDPQTASPGAYLGEIFKNGKDVESGKTPVSELGVSAPDDYTVVITLDHSAAYFPTMLSSAAFMPVRQDVVEKYGKDFASSADKNVYNGPFKLTDWAHDAKLTLTKNEYYWDKDSVKLDTVEISILTDPNTPIGMYETGDLDFVEVPVAAVDQYKDKASKYYDGSMDYLQINLNSGNTALGNKNFRKALSYGISRSAVAKLARGGMPQPTGRLVLPAMQGPTSTFEKDYPYDPYPADGDMTQAKAYLQKAMSELGVTDVSKLTFTLNYAESEATRKIVEVVQAQWKQNLGVDVTLSPVPYAVLYDNQATGDFQMMYTGWTPDYDDPLAYLELFATGGGYNYSHYSNAEYDQYIKAAQQTTDKKERLDDLHKAETVVCDDLPIIVLDANQKYGLWDQSRILNFRPYYVGTSWNFINTDIK